jgi:GNAT superfamily N-acetyltransferase
LIGGEKSSVVVRNTRREDFEGIMDVCREVYPESPPWSARQLESHLAVFPEGQFVAIEAPSQRVVGMAASLIVYWDDYEMRDNWRDFTDGGMFTNHDPVNGRTLYAAEVMVRPRTQGRGVGKKLYAARRVLVRKRKLLRIRAGARLRGYHRYADRMTAEDYVIRVVRKEIYDRTLSFQLSQGFRVLAVAQGYLTHDPESLGYAAVIEWLNRWVAKPEDYAAGDPRFRANVLPSSTAKTEPT